ncbi:MAG: adenosylmethionine--8-amino-7-oxononanoate transaminase [Myxococcota bacterium]
MSNTSYDLETLEAWDDQYVWHPFTPHAVYRDEEPLMVVAGEGNYLIDADGGRYLDGVASIWCNAVGHRHPVVDQAVKDQLGRIAHSTFLGHSGAKGVELARELVLRSPEGLTKVFFSDNGSTSAEIAMKMAYQYWGQVEDGKYNHKRKFLALNNGYNGDTIGAVSAGGVALFHAKFRDLVFETVRAPSPYCYRCPMGVDQASCQSECLEETVRLIEEHADELVAVIMEPGMQGAGGIITYPEGFLRRVREVTAKHDVFLILDEVAVGMGRSGKMFACEHEGVTPDFLCTAKMLTNGYMPLAATLTTDRVYAGFVAPPEQGKTFYHGHTFTGNALGAAAALATLQVYEDEQILEQLPEKIEHLHAQVQRLSEHPHIGSIRTFGLCAGLELVADRETKEPFDAALRHSYKICRYARDCGVFLRPLGDVLVLMPPLSVTRDEITLLVDALEYGLAKQLGEV